MESLTALDLDAKRPPLLPQSEIRLVRDRNVIVKQMLVVLGADVFDHLLLHAPITPHSRPGLIEGVWVLHGEGSFHHPAAIEDPPALDDVQVLSVRCSVNVDERLVVLSYGVDNKRVPLIMTDRLAVP